MEDVNIYDDLDNIDIGISLEKFEQENAVLTKRVNEQQQLILQMTSDINNLQVSNKKLQVNISELFKTAKAEITRKERDIGDLRRQVDDVIFQRQTKHPITANSFPDKDDLLKQIYNLRDEMEKKNHIITSLNKKLDELKELKNENFLKRRLEPDPNDFKYKKMKYENDFDYRKKYNRNYKNTFKSNYTRKYRSPSRSPDRPYRREKSRSPDRYRYVDTRIKPKLILSKNELMKIYGTDNSDNEKLRTRAKSPSHDHTENLLLENKYNRPRIGPRSPLYEDRNRDCGNVASQECSSLEETKELNHEYAYSDNIRKSRIGPRTPSFNEENFENDNLVLQPTKTENDIKTLRKGARNEEYIENEKPLNQTDTVTNAPRRNDTIVSQQTSQQSHSPISFGKPENYQFSQYTSNPRDSAKVVNEQSKTSQMAIDSKQNQKSLIDNHGPPRSRTKCVNHKDESEKLQQISKNENDPDILRNTPKSPKHKDDQLDSVKRISCTDSPPHDPRTYKNRKKEDTDLAKLNNDYQLKRLTSKEYFIQEQKQDVPNEYYTKEYRDILEVGEILRPQYEEEDCKQEELALMEARKKLNDEILSLEENIRHTKKGLHKKSKLRTLKADIWNDLTKDSPNNITSDTEVDPLLKPDKKPKKDIKKSNKTKLDSIAITKEPDNKKEKDSHKPGKTSKTCNKASADTKITRNTKSNKAASSNKSVTEGKNVFPKSDTSEKDTINLIESKVDIEITHSNLEDKINETTTVLEYNHKTGETSAKGIELATSNETTKMINALVEDKVSETNIISKPFSRGKDMHNLVDAIKVTAHARSFSRGKDMNNLIDALKNAQTDSKLNDSKLDDSILDDSMLDDSVLDATLLDDSKLDKPPDDTKDTTVKDVDREIKTSKIIVNFKLPPKINLDTKIDNSEDKISELVKHTDNIQIRAILTKLKDDVINNDTKIDVDNLKLNDINKELGSKIENTESIKSADAKEIKIKLKKTELVKENTSELKLKRKRPVRERSPRKCKEKTSKEETKLFEKDETKISNKDELSLLQEEMNRIFEEPIDTNIVKEPIIDETNKKKTKDIKLTVRRSPRKSKTDAKLLQESTILKQDIRNVVTVEDILDDCMLSEPVQEPAVSRCDKLDNTTTEVKIINTALTDQQTDTNILPPAQTGENNVSRKKLTGRRRRAIISII